MKLPDERAGTLLVFKTYPKISFGLIVGASNTIASRGRRPQSLIDGAGSGLLPGPARDGQNARNLPAARGRRRRAHPSASRNYFSPRVRAEEGLRDCLRGALLALTGFRAAPAARRGADLSPPLVRWAAVFARRGAAA